LQPRARTLGGSAITEIAGEGLQRVVVGARSWAGL
jgi:hypothetical protein